MIYHNTGQTFRGLPLTAEQDSEIRHYLKRNERLGKHPNALELREMIDDMLRPPSAEEDVQDEALMDPLTAAERAVTFVDQSMDPTEAYEDWIAAMEAETMKTR